MKNNKVRDQVHIDEECARGQHDRIMMAITQRAYFKVEKYLRKYGDLNGDGMLSFLVRTDLYEVYSGS